MGPSGRAFHAHDFVLRARVAVAVASAAARRHKWDLYVHCLAEAARSR
jgi:hypothetical protein